MSATRPLFVSVVGTLVVGVIAASLAMKVVSPWPGEASILIDVAVVAEASGLVLLASVQDPAWAYRVWLALGFGGLAHALVFRKEECGCMGSMVIGWRGEIVLSSLLIWGCLEVLRHLRPSRVLVH